MQVDGVALPLRPRPRRAVLQCTSNKLSARLDYVTAATSAQWEGEEWDSSPLSRVLRLLVLVLRYDCDDKQNLRMQTFEPFAI